MIPYEELVIIGLEVWHVGRFLTLFHPGISLIPTMETQKKRLEKEKQLLKQRSILNSLSFWGYDIYYFPLSGD